MKSARTPACFEYGDELMLGDAACLPRRHAALIVVLCPTTSYLRENQERHSAA